MSLVHPDFKNISLALLHGEQPDIAAETAFLRWAELTSQSPPPEIWGREIVGTETVDDLGEELGARLVIRSRPEEDVALYQYADQVEVAVGKGTQGFVAVVVWRPSDAADEQCDCCGKTFIRTPNAARVRRSAHDTED